MRVLVGCENSGVVRDAFIAKCHEAISCDLLASDKAGSHHQGDIVAYLNSFPDGWFDLIVIHPECTKLCVSGNSTYGFGMKKHAERIAAAEWTERLWLLCLKKGKRVCMENPVGVLSRMTCIPKAHYVQPWMFGHPEMKKTGLHLHGLTPLVATHDVYEEMMLLPKNKRERLHYMSPGPNRWKERSRTFQGIADAMAAQWGIA